MEITAYTTTGCVYCDKLKELFQRARVTPTTIVVGVDITREEFKEKFPEVNGFPHVIIDGESVGGLVETAKEFLKRGMVMAKKNA